MTKKLNDLRNWNLADCSQLLVAGFDEYGEFCLRVHNMAQLRENPPRLAFCDGIEHFNDLRFVSIVGFDSFDFYVDDLDVMQAECERAERRWWIQIGDGKDIPFANTAMISYAQSDYCRAV